MYNLLLVDDEAKSREALSLYFPWQDEGFRVVGQAVNGREALDFIAEKGNVDVVLTDIMMPVMNGIELAGAIFERKLDTRVIFLSSYREFEYAREALRYRVQNYIVKPAKYKVLLDVFRALKEEIEEKRRADAQADENEGAYRRDEGLIIAQIKSYIREHYRGASLEEIARRVHLNANYLSYMFKHRTGVNFTDYLIQVKMEAARKLLQDPQYKTYHVSEMVGYSNAKNFTRTFKAHFGMTPSEYRNGHSK